MKNRITFASIAALLWSVPWAAGASESPGKQLEEIVVTATFRETNLMDTPSGISAVGEEMIKELGAESIDDVFTHVAGLNFTSEEVGASRYAIRGISSQVGASQQQNTFSSVAVYIDNTPVTSALGPQGQTNGNLFDVNRVEVLKGPQGTLFGEGSQGGTIRYIFNQPDLSKTTASINTSLASMDESDDLSHRIDGVVNLPVSDAFGVRLLGFSSETAGYVDLTSAPAQPDYNTRSSEGGRVSALFRPGDNVKLTASAYISRMKTDGAPLVTSPYVAQTPVYPGLETRSFDDVDILDFTAEIDLGWALLTSVTSGLDREARSITGSPPGTLAGLDSFLAFQLNTQITLGNWPPVGPTGSVAYDQNNIVAGGFDHHTMTDRFIQEVRLVSPADQRLRWTAGLFYKKSDDQIVLAIPVIANPARSYLQEPFDLIFDSPTNKYRNELKELAAYGEVSYDLTDTVEVTLGARLSSPEQTITPFGGDSVFVDTPTDNLDLGYDETWFAPKLVLAWRPNDGLLTYASYAKGFRPGNANTLFLFSIPNAERARAAALLNNDAATAALADRDLAYYRDNFSYEGDELNSFEAGLKWSSAGRRLQVTAAAYRMEWEDMIMPAETPFVPVTSTTGNPSVFHANVGKAESQGIEFELTALATDRLMLRLAGDLLDTEFKHAPVAGESFAFAPEYSLSVMADYNLPLTANWSANLHINGSWIDEQKWSNSYGTSLNVSGSMLPSRHTVNARVTLRDTAEHWRIVLFARNLTNEQDLVSRVQNGGGDPLVFTLPRSIGVEIGWRL